MEYPHFMSPDQVVKQLQERLDYTSTKMRRMICANAKLIVTPASYDEKSKTVLPGDIQFDKGHCENDRRNGSKYCQPCSDDPTRNNGVPTDNKK